MKYSRVSRPSRKLLLMGRGIMSPRGFDTKPRIPAIWRIWVMFPRAPEVTIMSMGLKRSALNSSTMAACTSAVASVQIVTSC